MSNCISKMNEILYSTNLAPTDRWIPIFSAGVSAEMKRLAISKNVPRAVKMTLHLGYWEPQAWRTNFQKTRRAPASLRRFPCYQDCGDIGNLTICLRTNKQAAFWVNVGAQD
jgi:hypothetical protein